MLSVQDGQMLLLCLALPCCVNAILKRRRQGTCPSLCEVYAANVCCFKSA